MNRAEQLFGALLQGDMVKAADLSPWTKAVLDVPELTADDEALLEQQAIRLAPLSAPFPQPTQAAAPPEEAPPEPTPDAEPEPAPEEDPDHDDTEDPEEEAPEPVEEPGSTPHVSHDDIPTEELHVEPKGLPEQPVDEAFRHDFGFMFNSQEVVPDAYRIVLALKYKENWLDWEPETLWAADQVGLRTPHRRRARGKIMALRTCLKTNTPWIDWDAFEHVSQAFNDGLVIFGLMQPPELEDAAYTASVMRRLGDWPFGTDVTGYLAAVCLDAGLVYAPEEWFPSAQYFIDRQSKAPTALRDTVAAAWEKLQHVNLSAVSWRENNPVDNQVKKLWSVKSYLDSRLLQPAEPQGDTLTAGGAS